MDRERFRTICRSHVDQQRQINGIGTLGERTLHAVLKDYFSADTSEQEIRVGGFVADIVCDGEIIEIQTRAFDKLRKKLDVFLEQGKVTVVYPVSRIKRLCWIDQDTGEITGNRKSPKIGAPCEILFELYRIRKNLCHPNLTFCIMWVDMTEYRNLNGWSRDKKKGATRFDRIPVDLIEEIYIASPADYLRLIPEYLDGVFTSRQFAKVSKLTLSTAQTALLVLYHVGAVRRVGKDGNAFLYEKTVFR